MSAFINSGRSDHRKFIKITVCFRPIADVHPLAKGMSLLKLLRLKRALPLFRVDEPPFLVYLVTLEPEQN